MTLNKSFSLPRFKFFHLSKGDRVNEISNFWSPIQHSFNQKRYRQGAVEDKLAMSLFFLASLLTSEPQITFCGDTIETVECKMDCPLKELIPVSNNNPYQRNNHFSSFVPSTLSLFWLLKLFINKVQASFLHLTQQIQDTFFLIFTLPHFVYWRSEAYQTKFFVFLAGLSDMCCNKTIKHGSDHRVKDQMER